MRMGTIWSPPVPTAPSTGGAGQRHQIPVLMQMSLDSLWQNDLFPVPRNDYPTGKFNTQPGLNTNLFSPSSNFWRGKGKLQSKQGRPPHKWLLQQSTSRHAPPPSFLVLTSPLFNVAGDPQADEPCQATKSQSKSPAITARAGQPQPHQTPPRSTMRSSGCTVTALQCSRGTGKLRKLGSSSQGCWP